MGWSRLRLRRRAGYSDVSAGSEEKPSRTLEARTANTHNDTSSDQSFVSSESTASPASSSSSSSAASSPDEGGRHVRKFKSTVERLHLGNSDQCTKMLITGRNRRRSYGTF